MKIIKTLSCMIDDELEGAEEYIKTALQVKEDNSSLAEMFYGLAREEMGHLDKLHAAVVKLIKEYRDTHGDPPLGMQALYDYLHEAHMEKAARINWYLSKYAEK